MKAELGKLVYIWALLTTDMKKHYTFYIARGNGFCDRKYSDDFIEGQMEKYEQRIREIKKWIQEG